MEREMAAIIPGVLAHEKMPLKLGCKIIKVWLHAEQA
jgi:hypothetical protein